MFEIGKNTNLNKYPLVHWSKRVGGVYAEPVRSMHHIQGKDNKTMCGVAYPHKPCLSDIGTTFMNVNCKRCLKKVGV